VVNGDHAAGEPATLVFGYELRRYAASRSLVLSLERSVAPEWALARVGVVRKFQML
jgi:hypothetical protein